MSDDPLLQHLTLPHATTPDQRLVVGMIDPNATIRGRNHHFVARAPYASLARARARADLTRYDVVAMSASTSSRARRVWRKCFPKVSWDDRAFHRQQR